MGRMIWEGVQGFWCHGACSKLLPGNCCAVSMLICNMHQYLFPILIVSTPTQIPFHCSDHDSIPSLPFSNPLIPTLQFSFSLPDQLVINDPVFRQDNRYFLSTEEAFDNAMEKSVHYQSLMKDLDRLERTIVVK